MSQRSTLLGAELYGYREPSLRRAGFAISRAVSQEELLPARILRILALTTLAYPEVAGNADFLVRDDLGGKSGAVAPGGSGCAVPGRGQGNKVDCLRRMPAPQSGGMVERAASVKSPELNGAPLEVGREGNRCAERRSPNPLLSPNDLHHGRSRVFGRGRSLLQHCASGFKANNRGEFSGSRMVR